MLFGHRLNFRKRRQRRGGVEVVHHAEIFIEVGEKHYGKAQASVFHGKLGFVERLLLDAVLNLRLQGIAVRRLSLAFQIPRDVHEAFGLIQPGLRGGVLALRDDHSVIAPRDGHTQTAARYFGLRIGQSFRGFGAVISRSQQESG